MQYAALENLNTPFRAFRKCPAKAGVRTSIVLLRTNGRSTKRRCSFSLLILAVVGEMLIAAVQ